MPVIADFLFDDVNREKFAAHGISERQVRQVLDNEHFIAPNRRRRSGEYLVIGRDDGGACLAIPVQRTHSRTLWRPLTAWYCKPQEWARLD